LLSQSSERENKAKCQRCVDFDHYSASYSAKNRIIKSATTKSSMQYGP